MWTQFKILAATLVLTAIIWVYADQASQGTYNTVVRLKMVAGSDAEALPTILTPTAQASGEVDVAKLRVVLAGPKGAIQRVSGSERGGVLELKLRLPDNWTSGERRLDLMDAMNRSQDLLEKGLHVTSVVPSSIDIMIDRLTTVNFAVEPDLGTYARTGQNPVIRPASVQGTFRQSLLKQIGPGAPVVLLPVQDVLRDAKGTVGPVMIPLPSTVREVPVDFKLQQVEFSAVLSQKTTMKTLTRVAVSVLPRNSDMIGQYEVKWADTGDRFQTITVQVPTDRAESLKAEDVTAYVVISSDDLTQTPDRPTATGAATGGWVTRAVQFTFPAGFEEVRLEGTPPTVRLKVVKAAGAAATVLPSSPPRQ